MKTSLFDSSYEFVNSYLTDFAKYSSSLVMVYGNYHDFPDEIKGFFNFCKVKKDLREYSKISSEVKALYLNTSTLASDVRIISTKKLDKKDSKGLRIQQLNIKKDYSSLNNFFITVIGHNVLYAGYFGEYIFRFETDKQISFVSEAFSDLDILYDILFQPEYDSVNSTKNMLNYLKDSITGSDTVSVDLILSHIQFKSQFSIFKNIYRHLIVMLERKNYIKALGYIDKLLFENETLVQKQDFVSYLISIQSKILQKNILILEHKISEIEKKIFQFNSAFKMIIFSKLIEMLKVKIEVLEKKVKNDPSLQKELDDLKKEYKQKINNTNTNADTIYFLDDNQRKDLKKDFKRAVKLCHPDLVDFKHKKEAQKIFISLKNAYDRNDIETVEKIYTILKEGIFTSKDIIEDAGVYTNINLSYQAKRKKFNELLNDENYNIIKNIENFEDYFKDKLLEISELLTKYYDELNDLS